MAILYFKDYDGSWFDIKVSSHNSLDGKYIMIVKQALSNVCPVTSFDKNTIGFTGFPKIPRAD